MVFRPEAVRIARWLRRSENAATRQAFLDGYAAWKAKVGDGPERLAELFRTGDEPGHVAEYIAQWKRRIPCAFLRDGLCTIYAVRPLVCRNAHAVGTADRCYGDSADETPPVRIAADDVDSFVETSRGRIRAAHHALGAPRQTPAGLCDAVYALLVPA